jgi:hypothetical protein
MINILFQPCARHPDEILMGHYMFFKPIQEADTISVTANMSGFTAMNAVASTLGLSRDEMMTVADDANRKYEVCVVEHGKRRLMVVPRSIPKYRKYRRTCLTTDLLMACREAGVKRLHFTHFGFIQNKINRQDVERLFEVTLNPLVDSQFDMDFVIDADIRVIGEIKQIHNYFASFVYKLDKSKLKEFYSYE